MKRLSLLCSLCLAVALSASATDGVTPLRCPAEKGLSELQRALMVRSNRVYSLHEAAEEGDISTLRARLREGANPNQQDEFGRTPLLLAQSASSPEAVRILQEAGATADASKIAPDAASTPSTPQGNGTRTHGKGEAASDGRGEHPVVPRGTDLSQLNKGDADIQYRERIFYASKPLREVSQQLLVGGYSPFENPTGLFYREGETIGITLHQAPEGEVRLIIRDFRKGGGEDVYPLKVGLNELVVKRSGLGYFDYRHSRGSQAAPLRVSLKGGQINGIFSDADDADTWRRLLAGAPAGILDIVGKRSQLIYNIEGLRSGNPDRGPEMLEVYERIVALKQGLMGWDREGIHPGNHLLCRVMWGGYMHADGMGAVFNHNLIPGLSNPDSLRRAAWEVAHELGHINQLKPGFCWAGLQEVSNNIFSAWCNYKLNPTDLRLEHEVCPTPEGTPLRGGRFDCYVNNAVVQRQLWQFQGGPDSGIGKVPGARPGDHFVTLCPLWQLQLYFHEVRGQEDFFPRIYESLRAAGRAPRTQGRLRTEFCRIAGEAAQCNLGSFFLHTGMLAPMNRWVEDYSPHMVSINETMVEETLRALDSLPDAESSVIFYLTANSVAIYRDKQAVEPSADFCPSIPRQGGTLIFPADKWKNAVAFEVRRGNELIRICLRGLGMQDNASTMVICPHGATSIHAVQWDGTRYEVTRQQAE